MSRHARRFAALFAILALVFAQAMASVHACNAVGMKAAPAATAAAQPDGDCCDHEMAADPACDTHCQQGKQAPERLQAASAAPLVALGFVMPAALAPPAPDGFVLPAPDLARGTQPPIPIRHCCFRI